MIGETLLVYVFVIGAIKALFAFRGNAVIGDYLSAFAAILLIYVPLGHVRWRRLPVRFFERTWPEALSSLKLFAVTAAVIFPLFFLGAHLYNTVLFDARFVPGRFRWNWEEAAIQLFLIALPEEFFFRGYLQTMLAARFSKTFRLFGLRLFEVPWALLLASFLFAFSHSFIAFRWWHFAIFFPSLVFGWLRVRTNGLVASILFHATSNLAMYHIGKLYR